MAGLRRKRAVVLGVERITGHLGDNLRCLQLSACSGSYQVDWCAEFEAAEPPGADARRTVVTALNEHHCISKVVTAPAGVVRDDSAIDDFISERLEQLLPFPLKEVYYDYEVEQVEGDVDGDKARLLITAARRAAVTDHLNLMNRAGLQPQIIDTESQALTRALNYLLPYQSPHLTAVSTVSGEPLLVLNITANTTLVLIIQRQYSVFSRTLPTGLQPQTAGNELLQQVQRTLELFYQGQPQLFAGVILTGSAATLLNLEALRDILQMSKRNEVLTLNPLAQFHTMNAPCENGNESAFAIVVGLALRGFHAWHT